MPRFATVEHLGYLPLQDHYFRKKRIPLKRRDAVMAGRLTDLEDEAGQLGTRIADPDAAGDLIGGFNWPVDDNGKARSSQNVRETSAWAFAWPAVLTGMGQQKQGKTSSNPRKGSAQGPRARPLDEQFRVDNRFEEISVQLACDEPDITVGSRGIVLAATIEHRQVALFFPMVSASGVLLAPNFAGIGATGSHVFDEFVDGKPDPKRAARLQTMMRVLRLRKGCIKLSVFDPPLQQKAGCAGGGGIGDIDGQLNALAWQLGRTGLEGNPGLGLVYDSAGGSAGDPSDPVTPAQKPITKRGEAAGTGATVATQRRQKPKAPKPEPPDRGGGGEPTGVTGKRGIAALATHKATGPWNVGPKGDQHLIGTTADGEIINALHTDTGALYLGHGGDAPLEFQTIPYIEPIRFPYLSPVHLRVDKRQKHPFVCGKRKGMWRWEAEVPIYVAPPYDPGNGTPEEPPPKFPINGPGDPTSPVRLPFCQYGSGVAGGYHEPGGGREDDTPRSGRPHYKSDKETKSEWSINQHQELDFPEDHLKHPGEVPRFSPRRKERNSTRMAKDLSLQTTQAIAFSTVLTRPQLRRSRDSDLRAMTFPSASQVKAHNHSAPITMRREGYYQAENDGTPAYSEKPCQGRHRGGTAPGGVALIAPELDMVDSASEFNPTEGRARSEAYEVATPGVCFAAGLPSEGREDSPLHNGVSWGPQVAYDGTDGEYDLVFFAHDGNGAKTECLRIAYDDTIRLSCALLDLQDNEVYGALSPNQQHTETTHGFVVGEVVSFDGANFDEAISHADAANSQQAWGIVTEVVDANTFRLATSGILTLTTGEWDAVAGTTGGLDAGSIYYLTDVAGSEGQITSVEPETVRQVIGKALSSTQMLVLLRRPFATVEGMIHRTTAGGGGAPTLGRYNNYLLTADATESLPDNPINGDKIAVKNDKASTGKLTIDTIGTATIDSSAILELRKNTGASVTLVYEVTTDDWKIWSIA